MERASERTSRFSDDVGYSVRPGPLQYGGPKADGYTWPPLRMQPGAFLVCDVCGAAVLPTATDKHDAWHAVVR